MKNEKTIWIIIGLAIVLVLLFKSDFLGSVMTTCENNEPTTMLEYEAETMRLEGTFSAAQIFSLPQGAATLDFEKRTSNTVLGTYEYIDTAGTISCSDLLKIINQQDNTSSYIVLSKRQVLLTTTGVMWCNYENNIALKSTTVAEFGKYFQLYETCTEIVVEDIPPLPTEQYAEPIVITAENEGKQTETTPTKTGVNQYWYIAGGIAIIIIAYWFFNKKGKRRK